MIQKKISVRCLKGTSVHLKSYTDIGYQIVLCDLEEDGLEALEELKKRCLSSAGIIVIASVKTPGIVTRCVRAGAKGVLFQEDMLNGEFIETLGTQIEFARGLSLRSEDRRDAVRRKWCSAKQESARTPSSRQESPLLWLSSLLSLFHL